MGNLIKINAYDNDVTEYLEAEKVVRENFITGVIHLGRLLAQKRDKWKTQSKWTEYLEDINKSMAGANQFIRIYEYSEKHHKELLDAELTKWDRINKFLALPEELRLLLAKEINGVQIPDVDFQAKVDKAKGEESSGEKLKNIKNLDSQEIIIQELIKMAEATRVSLTKSNKSITENSKPFIISMLLGNLMMQVKDEHFAKLSKKERELWLSTFTGIRTELYTFLRKLT